jgi:hypothetical protein
MARTPLNWAILKLCAHLQQCCGRSGGKKQQIGKLRKWNYSLYDNGVMITLEYGDKGGYIFWQNVCINW